MTEKNYLFTSESVSEGHPDKVCDRISDMVVDTYLSLDPYSRVACETLTTTNKVVLAGETRGPKINNDDLFHKVKNCIKTTGYVNSTDDFIEQPKILNSASETLATVFGEKGKHTRVAVSANSLPLGIPVEIDALFEIN